MMRQRPRGKLERRAAVDWAEVHRRLARSSLETSAVEPGTDQAQALLAQRALALAAPIVQERHEAARITAVVAEIASQRYAIEAAHVWRVAAMPDVTRLPGAPEIVLGVINFYGEVLPIFDLRQLLGVGTGTPGGGRIVVLGTKRADLGLAVDTVQEVTTLLVTQILATPDFTAPEARALLRGVRADGLLVLDGAKLLTDTRLLLARPEPS